MSGYKVLVVHNHYQHKGGEDSVVDAEIDLLKSYGNDVRTYFRSNHEINSQSLIATALNTVWSNKTVSDIQVMCAEFRPDIIHVHNVNPLISPSLFWAANRLGIPVVQTLHNFRYMCLNALYLRNEEICEDCAGSLPWRGVLRKCYRDSTMASLGLASTLAFHRGVGTYSKKISAFIALNEFCKEKFVAAGLPKRKVFVKPNFVDASEPAREKRNGFLYVGRLSKEKGVAVLSDCARFCSEVKFNVAGVGPEFALMQNISNVNMLGMVDQFNVRFEMDRAVALILPSICYENFPRTIVEAFAAGLPVIASRIGAMAELVENGVTGLLFEPGDPRDLAEKVKWASLNSNEMLEMGKRAREKYSEFYTPKKNYEQMMSIYAKVLK